MMPTKAKHLNEIENLKEIKRKKDQQIQAQKDELILLNQEMILMNQAMIKTLEVSYEPS
jgi:5-methylcytosine-specific restriction endonuclease McrBC GTP-binding regulatory subunit McrB